MRDSSVPDSVIVNGACSYLGAPDFFSSEPMEVKRAKALCRTCPVRFECLQHAVSKPETWGIWGGADHWDIRAACAVDSLGAPARASRPAKCLNCRDSRHVVEVRELVGKASLATCEMCGLTWRRARSSVKKTRGRKRRVVPIVETEKDVA